MTSASCAVLAVRCDVDALSVRLPRLICVLCVSQAGLVEGTFIMCLVGYLSTAAMLMLIDCKYAILATGGRSIVSEHKVTISLQGIYRKIITYCT